MRETSVTIKDRVIEIPDGLIEPFKRLSTVMKGMEFENPEDILSFPAMEDIIRDCDFAIAAAIGKAFAHNIEVGEMLKTWTQMPAVETLVQIFKAARNTDPISVDDVFNRGRGSVGE